MNKWKIIAGVLCVGVVVMAAASGSPGGMPPYLYEEWRQSPAPVPGNDALVNPPSLQWASVKHFEKRSVQYRVELSQDENFPAGKTIRGQLQRWCFFNPHQKLASGVWYWRYEIQDGKSSVTKGPYSFVIKDNTPVFESPDFETFLAGVAKTHPRVITLGRDLADIHKSAATHPLAASMIEKGQAAAKAPVYYGPLDDADPAKAKALTRVSNNEVLRFHSLVDAYVLTGDAAMREALLTRIDVLLTWPTDDLLGSKVLTCLSKAYDALYSTIPPQVRKRMLAVIAGQLEHGLKAWPGDKEGRQVENHFWQMELAGNFTAALATVHDLEPANEMLEYTYELFLARFPNLAASDGGWAEGFGYFGVNKSAVVDMALLMKKIGGADVFKMQWYQNLPDYYIYFAPVGGRIDGFGDMHDRVGEGDVGQNSMLVLGVENQDPKAIFRLSQMAGKDVDVEAWYQVVENLHLDLSKVPAPAEPPQARMFAGVGLAALHSDVLDSSRDTAVYFRSSPFGAKGHMHANQNAFNLSRKGEPLFYSTGYYTSFCDPHAMSSYRHTRAHNTILVNGCGQAYGHEGYGWIKRFANGSRIGYACGDATMAYRPTVDEQFLDMMETSNQPNTREYGYGDSMLKLFERHVMLLHPDTVVVYDVLESEQDSDWTLLLHTMKPPGLDPAGLLRLDTGKNVAEVYVSGSQPLKASLTDEFFSPAIDFKKKYKATPRQYHLSYVTQGKSKSMRFLTVLQLGDQGAAPVPVEDQGNGTFRVGDTMVRAELDASKPARLSAQSDKACLYINDWPSEVFGEQLPPVSASATLLVEKNGAEVSVQRLANQPPVY
ncbi:DUF4962 domain-containing protein [Pontiella sulfatireligans]|uniref:Uncharacterized protein n=1 Tax=Pontiella sulfatireligans TaxID=2750658 RepID=A0A6C2UQH7_9BACT|nr:DUF4962 domain-containing protein [Pontiella sulfatireligans]VGO22329.1 hypothetical protein SCARR_04412 [Pontiella sulfatireligans]